MSLSREILFFFSALGAFNGLLFGVYFLLFAQPRNLSRRLFGAFMLMLSVRVGKSVFLYFNRGLAREFLQVGLTACLFIGPFLYFFVRSVNEEDTPVLRRSLILHLISWALISLLGGTLYSYRAYPELWQQFVVYGIYCVWGVYTLAAIYAVRNSIGRLFRSDKTNPGDRMLVFTTLGTLAVLSCYAAVRVTSYLAGALTFSLLLYSTWAASRWPQSMAGVDIEPAPSVRPAPSDKRSALLSPEQETKLTEKLARCMAEDRLYVNPNLKLADLAEAINATTHQVSYLLNTTLGSNFHRYLNEQRIGLAQNLIRTEDHLTLEAIGDACGFNSRSTFYKAFKKSCGITPAKFRESL